MILEIIPDVYFKIEIISDYIEILKVLNIGINIPIPQFKEYIIDTFNKYSVRAILLKEKQNKELSFNKKEIITGVAIIFNEDSETLFFGFFGVCNHDSNRIQKLINTLLNYAKNKKFRYINGPINIPTIIFGFGFKIKGLDKKLCIGKPLNPLIYPQNFMKNGFYPKHIFDSYSFSFRYINLKLINYNFSDYEFLNIKVEDLANYIKDILNLHVKNMPKFTQITPNPQKNAMIIYYYLLDNAEKYDIWIVRHKSSNNIIGCGYKIPNPFSKNQFYFEQYIIDKSHQEKGLSILMGAKIMEYELKNKKDENVTGIMLIENKNKKMIRYSKKYFKALKDGIYLVLEYKL